jgi:hypothetical protein
VLISSTTKVVLWVIATVAGVVVAILGNELGKNIIYFLTRRGRPPTKRPHYIWIIFFTGFAVLLTSGALATFAPAPPVISFSTFTPTFSQTLEPTSIPIPTETARFENTYDPSVPCNGHTENNNSRIFNFPSEAARYELIPSSTSVKVIGQIQDRTWYKVETMLLSGWMRSTEIVLDNCFPNTYKISFLLGFDPKQENLLMEETFSNGWQDWKSSDSGKVTFNTTADGENRLTLNGADGLTLVESKLLPDISEFQLTTSFQRLFISLDGYIGIRLVNESGQFYDIQVSSTCEVTLFNPSGELVSRVLSSTSCSMNNREYWIITLDSSDVMTVAINDSEPIPISISNFRDFQIQLEAKEARADFDFLVITSPR